jgi:peptidoglycan biosynthesis protein MviN/MurJ (putative lipid II flippase)
VAWVPVMDALTGNKYGAVNKTTFFLLSFCIPFQYMINLLWTIQFAQNQLQRIFRITAITSAVIIIGDLLMIPMLNAKGAAIVYLLATAIEYIIYLRCSVLLKITESWQAIIICTGIALVSGFSVEYIGGSLLLKLILVVIIYSILLLITRQVKRNDWQIIKVWI